MTPPRLTCSAPGRPLSETLLPLPNKGAAPAPGQPLPPPAIGISNRVEITDADVLEIHVHSTEDGAHCRSCGRRITEPHGLGEERRSRRSPSPRASRGTRPRTQRSVRRPLPVTFRPLPIGGPMSVPGRDRSLAASPALADCRTLPALGFRRAVRRLWSPSQSSRFLNRSEAMSSPTNMKPSSQRVSPATCVRPASRSITARMARMKWVAGSTSAMYWAGRGMPS